MALDWLAFPLIIVAVSFGCGLLVERATGWRMSGVVVTGVGLAAIFIASSLLTQSSTLAPATPWIVLGLALLGWATSWRRLRELRPDGWLFAVAILLFAVYAAPVVASGQATFLGYGIDGDPAFHFLLIRELIAHGQRPLTDLPFQLAANVRLQQGYFGNGYPLGGDTAVGALRPLIGQDVPWIYDPFIATMLTLGGLTIEELLHDAVRSRPLRALCAFVAAQAGLAYSFYLISSIKELATTWLVTLLVVLVFKVLRRPPSVRALIPIVVVVAAELYALAIPGVPWIAIPAVVFLVASLLRVRNHLRRPSPRVIVAVLGLLAVGAAISYPVLRTAVSSFETTTGVLTTSNASAGIGNLIAPLKLWQILGIWPTGDYRIPLTLHVTLVYVLISIAGVSAIIGALWTIYRRAWGPLLLLLGNGIAAWVLLTRASPYAASKVEMILSITAVLGAMLGAVALSDLVRPWLGWALGAVIALAVLWTNSKSFRQAPLGPRARFAELSQIDNRFAGTGPTFYNLWDFEWPSYFMRKIGPTLPHIYGDPLSLPDSAYRTPPQLQIPWDTNVLVPAYLNSYKLIVLGRSPIASRPPANYRLVYRGRYYVVYERGSSPRVLKAVVGTDGPEEVLYHPPALTCARIRRLGREATHRHARLEAAISPTVASVRATDSHRPYVWQPLPISADPIPHGLSLGIATGTLRSVIHVPRAGRYTVWLQGNLSQKMTVRIDGHVVGSVSNVIGPAGLFTDVGSLKLPGGAQQVTLTRSARSRLHPDASTGDYLGMLALSHTGGPPRTETVSARHATALCGQKLQWIDIVR